MGIIELLSFTKPKWFKYLTWVVGSVKGNTRIALGLKTCDVRITFDPRPYTLRRAKLIIKINVNSKYLFFFIVILKFEHLLILKNWFICYCLLVFEK